jgi:endosialidase-like protein
MAFNWLRRGFTGEVDYNPEHQTLNVDKANQERQTAFESRQEQGELGTFYKDAIAGKGPSVAEKQMYQGRDQAIKAGMATAAGARGGSQAMAQRVGAQQAAAIGQSTSRDAAMLRAQEQMNYAGQYSNLLQAKRMQDLTARGYSIDEAKAQLDYDAKYQKLNADLALGETAGNQKGAAGLIGAAGGALAAISDERAKQNVQPVGMQPPIRAAGGMEMQQMQAPPQNMNTVLASPDRQPAGPSFGSKLASVLGASGAGYAGGVSGNQDQLNKQLMDLRKQQQEDSVKTSGSEEEEAKPKQEGGGLLGGLGGAASGYAAGLGSDIGMKTNVVPMGATSRPVGGPGTNSYGLGGAFMSPGQMGGQNAGALPMYYAGSQQSANATPPPDYSPGTMSDKHSKENIKALSNENKALKDALNAARGFAADVTYPDQSPPVARMRPAIRAGAPAITPPSMPMSQMDQHRVELDQLKGSGVLTPEEARTGAYPRPPEQVVSDEKAKNVSNLSQALSKTKDQRYPLTEEMSQLPAYSYNYKAPYDQMYGAGQKVGPVAQDMEKVAPVAHTVQQGPDGMRRVDTGQLALSNTSAISEMSRRLKELEAQKDAEVDDLRRVVGVEKPKGSPLQGALQKKSDGLRKQQMEQRSKDLQSGKLPMTNQGVNAPYQPIVQHGYIEPGYKAPAPPIKTQQDTLTKPWAPGETYDKSQDLSWAQQEASRRNREAEQQGYPNAGDWRGTAVPGFGSAVENAGVTPGSPLQHNKLKSKSEAPTTAPFAQEHTMDTRKNPKTEDRIGALAAALSKKGSYQKDIQTRSKQIKKVSRYLAGPAGMGGGDVTPSPQHVFDELKSRGVPITKKEVTEALRSESEM